MNGNVGMYHAKNSGSSLSNTIKDTSTIMRNPSLHNPDKGVTHDCASILDSIAKGTFLVSIIFRMVYTSLHRHSFSRMIFTLVVLYTVDINACVEKSSHSCMSNGIIAVT